mgnify:CR=1 FL=1
MPEQKVASMEGTHAAPMKALRHTRLGYQRTNNSTTGRNSVLTNQTNQEMSIRVYALLAYVIWLL